jgi:hypothetical protein
VWIRAALNGEMSAHMLQQGSASRPILFESGCDPLGKRRRRRPSEREQVSIRCDKPASWRIDGRDWHARQRGFGEGETKCFERRWDDDDIERCEQFRSPCHASEERYLDIVATSPAREAEAQGSFSQQIEPESPADLGRQ